MLTNKTILITGGTGSVGKVLSLYFIRQNIKELIIYSRDEYKQFMMKNLPEYRDTDKIKFIIGDIRNYNNLKKATLGVDYIIHTAALKHVSICESNPNESIDINIQGSENIIDASLENNVEKVLFISTDKANNPSNTYGASKLLGDKLCIDANKYNKTKFSIIRFGNIFGSRGSLIESLFNNKSGEFILTDLDISRVFISWKDLLNKIIYGLETMKGGEIFVPINKSIHIKDIINIINDKLEIKIGGLREGEKKIEILLSKDDIRNTIQVNDIYIVLSKWCQNHYKNYNRINENTVYTSENNDFYTKNEIVSLIDNMENFIN